MAIPDSLTRFLKTTFPTLPIRQTWLAECVEYLQSELNLEPGDELNSSTLDQILMANLEDVTTNSSLPNNISDLSKGQIGLKNTSKNSVLVQIVGMTDIGISAQNQIQVLESRKQIKNSPGMAALLNNVDDPSLSTQQQTTQNGNGSGSEDHMRAFGEQEQELTKSSTVFSRSMLQLFLTDGHSSIIPAFERTRIPELDLATTPLGCKILLKGAQVRRGQILLEPNVIEIKGGSIPEMIQDSDLTMMNLLRNRIGQPPLEAQTQSNLNQESNREAVEMGFNVDSDEEAALQAIQEEEAESVNRRRRNQNQNQNSNSSRNSNQNPNQNPKQNQNQNQNQNRSRSNDATNNNNTVSRVQQTPEFDEDEDDDELFAMIDEHEGQVIGNSNSNKNNRNQQNNRFGNVVANHEVIDLSDSP